MDLITKRIYEIADVVGGGTPSTSNEEYWGGDIPWLSPADLTGYQSVYISHGEKFITPEGVKKSSTQRLPAGSVLFSSRAPIGYIAIAQNEIYTNQGFKSLVCKSEVINNLYLYYYLKLNLNYIKNFASGATFPELSANRIKNIKITFCKSLHEQQKIASILSAYDSQIENNQKRIKLLEQMAENLYKEWFVRFRFPGYENAEFEGGVPKGWTRCKLGDLIDFQNGFAFKSETFVPEGKYKVITIKNVQDGQFDSSNADRVEDIPKGMPSYCKLSEGDILLSLTGNVGRVCHVIGNNMLLNQRVAKIKSSHSHFAYCMLRTPAMFAYLNMIAYGTAQLNLSPIKAANLKIIKPTESIMEAFDKVVAPLFSSVFNLYNQIDFLSSQRDLLLPRLMSGKLSI